MTRQDGLILGVFVCAVVLSFLIACWIDLRKEERQGGKLYPGPLPVRYVLHVLCCMFGQAFDALLSGI